MGDVRAEHEVLGTGAAVADLGHTTRVLHKGGDALDLLNRLTTNDLGGLAAGASRRRCSHLKSAA